MNCKEVAALLTAWLDGELTAPRAAEVEAHLANCADCAQARDEIVSVREMADAWTTEGGDVWASVQHAIETEDLRALLRETQALRAEMQTLRAEIADLKRQLSSRAPTPARPSTLLFPYAPTDTPRPIV